MRSYRCLLSLAVTVLLVTWPRAVDLQVAISLLSAVIVHELGHIAAIYSMGMRVERISIEPCGLRMDYGGTADKLTDIVLALAGPASGIIFYLLSKPSLCAELSLGYALFNLLPLYPLDGGRAVSVAAEKIFGEERGIILFNALSRLLCVAFTVVGLVYFLIGEGGAVFSAGLWLLLMQYGN